MSKKDRERRKKRKREKEVELFGERATFLAGIVVLISVVNNIIEIRESLCGYLVLIEIITLFIAYCLVSSKRLDFLIVKSNTKNASMFLTTMSIVVFALTLIMKTYKEPMFVFLSNIVIGVIIIACVIFLFLKK